MSLLAFPLVAVGLLASGSGSGSGWGLIAVVYLATATPWLANYDIREHRLPNALVVPGIGAGLLSCAGEWAATGSPPLVPLLAGAVYAGFLLVLNLLGGMGMGDVKLATALGLASWSLSVAVLSPVVAFLVGGVVSIVLLMTGKRGRRIAFGPFLLGGFWVAVTLEAVARFLMR
jgi:leader peptidase (prepilin peptidase)/N-methyltransferase